MFWAFIAGYVVGAILCYILCRPTKMYKNGYETAKESYGDWKKGFEAGWDAAFQAIRFIAEQVKYEINRE